jgi:hypothetical protein
MALSWPLWAISPNLEIGPLRHKVNGPEPSEEPSKISLDFPELFL